MFNSRNLGALIVKEKPHVKSWDEPQYSIQNLAIEESYGFGVLNEGQAIAVAPSKNPHDGISTPKALDILSHLYFQTQTSLISGGLLSCSKRSTPQVLGPRLRSQQLWAWAPLSAGRNAWTTSISRYFDIKRDF